MSHSAATPTPESHRFLSTIATAFVWFVTVSSLAAFAALTAYTIHNDSGHTAFDPWLLSLLFVPSLIIGSTALPFRRTRFPAILTLASAIAGLALLFYLDHFNVLVQYDRWIERGMP
jgi:hypothetical protein